MNILSAISSAFGMPFHIQHTLQNGSCAMVKLLVLVIGIIALLELV